MKKVFLLSISLVINSVLMAQPGKDGAKTVSGNQILNSYSPLTSNAAVGSTSVNVISQSTLLKLCPGDLIMIYQAQGANINTANSALYGTITAYNSAGLYELCYVKDVNGNTIDLASPLNHSYTVSGMTQVVKIPQFSNLAISTGATITPKPWKDTIVSTVRYRFGGIIGVHCETLSNNGSITSAGMGFRGGQLDLINGGSYNTSGVTLYTSSLTADGGERGESIAGYQPEYDAMGGRYGRGAAANGGGGGDGWNAGGGGGANGDNGNIWTGQGVMTVNGTNPLAAWALDPGYIANGNSLTTSSGGGRGGYSVAFYSLNPNTTAPGNTGWGADNRREVGGLGGHPLTNIGANNRIYFGGGGGAGDENNFNGGAGGNGGGIVYLIATAGISGSGIISVRGNDGFNTTGSGYDAPGGAGAGGSVIIKSPSVSPSQTIIANGGFGGNQNVSGEVEGPGGGGGGGFAGLGVTSPTAAIFGGGAGQTNSNIMTGFTYEGATWGNAGQSATISNTVIPFNINNILSLTSNSPLCAGSTLMLTCSSINGATYVWAGPNSFTSSLQNPSITGITLAGGGVYTASVIVGSCPAVSNMTTVVVNSCTDIKELNANSENHSVYPNPSKGNINITNAGGKVFQVSIYSGEGKLVKQLNYQGSEMEIKDLAKGIYTIKIKNEEGQSTQKLIIE